MNRELFCVSSGIIVKDKINQYCFAPHDKLSLERLSNFVLLMITLLFFIYLLRLTGWPPGIPPV